MGYFLTKITKNGPIAQKWSEEGSPWPLIVPMPVAAEVVTSVAVNVAVAKATEVAVEDAANAAAAKATEPLRLRPQRWLWPRT